ncbi:MULTISPECIES: urease accessory protein UreD [unclassified Beijerinckia]|uniref:urease accessory protein UreD n=1 Tax=unclassified Beijerinckia TaxID=2638183 RepID=UPI001FCDE6B1|nr:MULTISPECIES: urease accessory protein UreD [unclassified Beijerinckia]
MIVGNLTGQPRVTSASPDQTRWQAQLELWFENRADKTCLVRRRHVGPLAVQRPFYPERDGTTHVYLLHPPGGVVGGDQLEISCHLSQNARALLTTPGAAKFYRSPLRTCDMRTNIDVAAGAICEYFPQETILFDGCNASIETLIDLAPDAVYMGWDVTSFGRPAADERFTSGAVRQCTKILRAGRPIWFERLHIESGSTLIDSKFGLAEKPILGTMIYAGPMVEDLAERIRAVVNATADHGVFSVSQLEQTLVCRYLGASAAEAKSLFARAWDVLRRVALGKPAVTPRIWST